MIFRIFLCYSLQLEAIRGLPGTADRRSYAIRWRSLKYPPLLLNFPPQPLLISLLSSSSLWGFLKFSLSETADWLTNRGILSLFSLSLYAPCHSRLFSVLPLFSHHLSFGRALSSSGIFEGIRGLQAAPSSSLPASLPPSLSSSSFPPCSLCTCGSTGLALFDGTCLWLLHTRTHAHTPPSPPPSSHP